MHEHGRDVLVVLLERVDLLLQCFHENILFLDVHSISVHDVPDAVYRINDADLASELEPTNHRFFDSIDYDHDEVSLIHDRIHQRGFAMHETERNEPSLVFTASERLKRVADSLVDTARKLERAYAPDGATPVSDLTRFLSEVEQSDDVESAWKLLCCEGSVAPVTLVLRSMAEDMEQIAEAVRAGDRASFVKLCNRYAITCYHVLESLQPELEDRASEG